MHQTQLVMCFFDAVVKCTISFFLFFLGAKIGHGILPCISPYGRIHSVFPMLLRAADVTVSSQHKTPIWSLSHFFGVSIFPKKPALFIFPLVLCLHFLTHIQECYRSGHMYQGQQGTWTRWMSIDKKHS